MMPSSPEEFRSVDHALASGAIQPGDIVYMSSRYLDIGIQSLYALVAAAYMGTPFYHVFVALPDGKMGHFVHDNYRPQLPPGCADGRTPNLQFGSLREYMTFRQAYRPVYRVMRSHPRDLAPTMLGLCGRVFPPPLLILASTLGAVRIDPNRYAHCNSYVGMMLERLGLLKPSPNPHRDYIPSTLLHHHLPKAGFAVASTFTIA
jgi:hypothetical protein